MYKDIESVRKRKLKKSCSKMKLKLQQKFERVRQKKKEKSSKIVSKYATLDNEEDVSHEVKHKKHTKFTSKHAGTAKKFKYAKQRDSVHWDDATDYCAVKRSQIIFKDFTPLIVETFD